MHVHVVLQHRTGSYCGCNRGKIHSRVDERLAPGGEVHVKERSLVMEYAEPRLRVRSANETQQVILEYDRA